MRSVCHRHCGSHQHVQHVRVVFIRHGKAENQEYGINGLIERGIANEDCSLVEEGRQQLHATKEYLARQLWEPDVILTSPFVRTRESAMALFPGRSYVVHDSLREYWRGIWYTLPKKQIQKHYPSEWKLHEAQVMTYHHRPPQGESVRDVHERITSFLTALQAELQARRRIAIIGHGNWLLMLRSLQLNIAPNAFPQWFAERRSAGGYANASVTSFMHTPSNEGIMSDLHMVDDNVVPWAPE